MAGTRIATDSTRRLRRAASLLIAALVALALMAPAASASSPAGGEYQLNYPPGGGGSGGQGGPRAHNTVGSSQSDSALPVLLVGFVAIGSGGLAFAYLRRRRSGPVS